MDIEKQQYCTREARTSNPTEQPLIWVYRFDERALKELRKLGKQAQRDIIAYLDGRNGRNGVSSPVEGEGARCGFGDFIRLWRG